MDPGVDMWEKNHILKYFLLDICYRIQHSENNAKNYIKKFLPVPEKMNVEFEEISLFLYLLSCEYHYLSN